MRHEVLLRTSNGRKSIIIDSDFCQSLSVPVGDNEDTIALFVASWVSLLADSPLEPDNKPYKLYTRFLHWIKVEGIKGIVVRFSDLAHQLVSRHTLMGSDPSIGDWIVGFKDTPVFFEYNRYYKTGDTKLLDYLYTFLNFGKKLDYVDEAFHTAAFRDWLGVEKRLDDLVLQDTDISALRTIIYTALPPFEWQDLRPKFGPGSVQERGVRGRIDKLRSLRYDPLIDRFLLRGHIGKYGFGADQGIQISKVIPDPDSWTPARGISSRSSKLMFVPKNLKISRSICMEPNTLMFFQQAVLAEELRLLKHSAYSVFIDIADQTKNQVLSQAGSLTSEIDTIDLSAASDSVSLDLVKRVFPRSWLIPMLATRSKDVILPNGDLMTVKKFAPMGSALCFPTQCIIFASVCVYAACLYAYEVEHIDIAFLDWLTPSVIRRVIGLFQSSPGYYPRHFQPCSVYGDDICVDRRLTPIVNSILSRLGFVVNESKSFVGSQAFRESCGKFYMSGNDITPLYFRIKDIRRKLCAEHVVSHVHLANEAYLKGYKSLYRFLRASIATWECEPRFKDKTSAYNAIPYVSNSDTFGILAREPQNKHLRKRENKDYQRTEQRVWTISYDYSIDDMELLPVIDAYEYMRWWSGRGAGNTTADSFAVSRRDTGGARLSWRWIPAE